MSSKNSLQVSGMESSFFYFSIAFFLYIFFNLLLQIPQKFDSGGRICNHQGTSSISLIQIFAARLGIVAPLLGTEGSLKWGSAKEFENLKTFVSKIQ